MDAYVRLLVPAETVQSPWRSAAEFLESNQFLGKDPQQLRNVTFLDIAFRNTFTRCGYHETGFGKARLTGGSQLRYLSIVTQESMNAMMKADTRMCVVRQEAKIRHANEEMDLRFPINNGQGAVLRDAITNREVLGRYISLERIWSLLQDNEYHDKSRYKHVIFLSENMRITSNFALPVQSLNDNHMYVLSRGQSSLMISRRSHAHLLALHLSTLVEVRDACVDQTCSSRRLLHIALEQYRVDHPNIKIY